MKWTLGLMLYSPTPPPTQAQHRHEALVKDTMGLMPPPRRKKKKGKRHPDLVQKCPYTQAYFASQNAFLQKIYQI